MYIGVHVKYSLFLPDFNAPLIFSTEFGKNPQISNFMKIRRVGSELFYADRQTDNNMTKLIVAVRNFANAHKNCNLSHTW
jgi:hypothetical protein